MKTVDKKKYYSLEEAAQFLDETIEIVRSWIGKGSLPTRVVDGRPMIPATPLNDFYHKRLPNYKICTKCGIEKQINEFNRHPTSRDGLQSNCRECNKVRARERYQQNRGKLSTPSLPRTVERT
ncbi:MAG: hypothetical protein AVDCRST_MAG14-2723 [uncultured Rubrobacteraceae bacterium]|uniref:Helix-turn-helix domain-containing protein n=1 Tax=uncultured Rubrobacteraceae bacterium TaxID=349277 RepID=A0A6J4R9E3_9ACTN|nr:MAG: hypothetical protein AVDCRST_MAG14-2723 [uncultured Rubrobacteraceae bacterium]